MRTAAIIRRRLRQGGRTALLLGPIVFLAAAALPVGAGDLPPGDGRAVLEKNCADCHPIDSITDKRQSETDWRASVTRMVSYGVDLTPAEIDQLVAYLTQNFGVTPARR